mgnify:CR=1 FL=1
MVLVNLATEPLPTTATAPPAAPTTMDDTPWLERAFTVAAPLAVTELVLPLTPARVSRSNTFTSARIPGASTQRVIDLCLALRADHYLTGHGARHYLDHQAFEARGITVSYIKYGTPPYPQLHGEFTPYVSALDLIANRGPEGIADIGGQPLAWREFLSTPAPATT